MNSQQPLRRLIALGVALLVLSACGTSPTTPTIGKPDAIPPPTSTSAPEPTASPTTESTATEAILPTQTAVVEPTAMTTAAPTTEVHPADTRTGIADVDNVIDAILSNDIEARRALVHYTVTPCTTAPGLGGPPKCHEGEADGTPVEVFPILESEGHHVRRDSIDRGLGFMVEGLYAVFRVPDDAFEEDYWPAGEYGLVFIRKDMPEGMNFPVTVLVENGQIVRLDFNFADSPATALEQNAGEMVLSPP
jgi:hypothetical protein